MKTNKSGAKFTITTNKVKSGDTVSYFGRIKYYNDDMYLYSEFTGISRLSIKDAEADALWLAENH